MDIDLLEPWYAPRDRTGLEARLANELTVGHVLRGVSVRALAQRQDRDDVLFEVHYWPDRSSAHWPEERTMSASVNIDDLIAAMEWVSTGEAAGIECSAYVSRRTGRVHWVGEGIDEAAPDDIADASVYVGVPHKADLDLGRALALRFVERHLPQSCGVVREYFAKRGAYARFKTLLERSGQLDAWHRYEEQAEAQALSEWCEDLGLGVAAAPAR